jgi:hypothetical protein
MTPPQGAGFLSEQSEFLCRVCFPCFLMYSGITSAVTSRPTLKVPRLKRRGLNEIKLTPSSNHAKLAPERVVNDIVVAACPELCRRDEVQLLCREPLARPTHPVDFVEDIIRLRRSPILATPKRLLTR